MSLAARNRCARRSATPVAEPDLGGGGEALEHLDELGRAVVREVDVVGEPAAQTGVRVDERAHLVRVAGDDDRQVVAVVLHQLDQHRDRLGAELAGPFLGERVGLVDEQDATDRPVDDGLHLERGLADVAGHEIGPRDLDEVAAADQADAAVQPGDDPRDRGLARPGIAGEDDVQARAHLGECLGPPFGVEQVDREQPPDRDLDLGQPDQRVQLGQDRLGRLGDDHGRRPGRRRGLGRGFGRRGSAGARGPGRRGRGRTRGRAGSTSRVGTARPEPLREVEDRGLRVGHVVDRGQLRLGLGGHGRCRPGLAGGFEERLAGRDRDLGRCVVIEDADQTPEHVPELDLGVRVRLGDRDRLVAYPVADHSDGSV